MTISNFQGDHRFLSNFYQSPIEIDGTTFPTAEHAFQAFKDWNNDEYKEELCANKNPVVAKRKGKNVEIDDVLEWNRCRIYYMLDILRRKFDQNPELAETLLATGDDELIEGNCWNDKYWGVCKKTGDGLNMLGKLLMQVRDELRQLKNEQSQIDQASEDFYLN